MKKSGSSAANRKFALSGPADRFDPRVVPLRGDLADLALAGHVFAPHYIEPMAYHCAADFAPLLPQSDARAEPVSEILAGESFRLIDLGADWAWGQAADGACGFVALNALAPGAAEANGRAALSPTADSLTAFAEAALGAAHVPGGRGGAGYDAGGLVQRAAQAIGIDLPRFADLQAKSDALKETRAPAPDVLLFTGDIAAICVSNEEAVAALPERGVVRLAISELLAGEPDALYRARP